MSEGNKREYFDVAKLADYIHSTPAAVRQAVYRRRLPFLKLGRRVLFDREEIDKHLAACRVEAAESGNGTQDR
jgi:excisionase family DNA binding protein